LNLTSQQELKAKNFLYIKTLKAMRSQITVPIMLIGLAAPQTFRVQAKEQKGSPYKSGEIVPT
jgi:hypothetical protein